MSWRCLIVRDNATTETHSKPRASAPVGMKPGTDLWIMPGQLYDLVSCAAISLVEYDDGDSVTG